jgi:hypothetical protein
VSVEGGLRVIYMGMYFVSIYENRRMKPVEIVLRRGEGGRGRMEGGNPTKVYFKHICKYCNVSPIKLLYANKAIKN